MILQMLSIILALTSSQVMELYESLVDFCDQQKELINNIAGGNEARLKMLETKRQGVSVRYDAWSAKNLESLAESDVLMQLMEQFVVLNQTCTDSITSEMIIAQMRSEFLTGYNFLASKDTVYSSMVEKAKLYSAVQQSEGLLKKLQAREKVMFSEIQSKYEAAHTAAQTLPGFERKCQDLESMFENIQEASTSIQEAKYVPFVTRIKDYMINLACVALLLNLLVMLKTKLSAAKQMKEGQAKMKEMLDKANDPLPRI